MGVGRIGVVSDAGPLIHLAEIDCLSLLVVFENLHVPETICREVFNHGLSWAGVFGLGIVQQHTLSRSEVAQFIKADVSSLFVTRTIVELAIEQLHRHPTST